MNSVLSLPSKGTHNQGKFCRQDLIKYLSFKCVSQKVLETKYGFDLIFTLLISFVERKHVQKIEAVVRRRSSK